jgi:hypothetical protein
MTLAAWSTCGFGAGLGAIEVLSGVGQQLRANVQLIGVDASEHGANCSKVRLESLDGSTVITPRVGLLQSGQSAMLQLTTRQSINEPAITIFVSYGCDTAFQREYQILLDPVLSLPTVPKSQPAEAPPSETRPQSSSPQRAANPQTEEFASTEAPRKGRSARNKAANAAPVVASAAPEALPAPATVNERRPKRLKASQAPRSVLRLSGPPTAASIDTLASLEPSPISLHLKRADALTIPTGQTDPQKMAELREEQAKFAAVMRDEDLVQTTQLSMKQLQTELGAQHAEAARLRQQSQSDQVVLQSMRQESRDWIGGLGAVLAVCLGALGWLIWRSHATKRGETHAAWSTLIAEPNRDTTDAELLTADTVVDFPFSATFRDPIVHVAEQRDHTPTVVAARDAASIVEPKEISDVMELAEAWMALNDPQKVLELLAPFGEVEQPESPLPWIGLLDAYRILGNQKKYEEILERIRSLFNVRLAPWDEQADVEPPKTLADYPHITAKILSLWETEEVAPYLENLERDNRDGTREGFDLPAYRDIMKLISLADNPDRLKQREIMNEEAYTILFLGQQESDEQTATAVDHSAGSTNPESFAVQTIAPASPALKQKIRERPKYVTTSYQRVVLGDGIAGDKPRTARRDASDSTREDQPLKEPVQPVQNEQPGQPPVRVTKKPKIAAVPTNAKPSVRLPKSAKQVKPVTSKPAKAKKVTASRAAGDTVIADAAKAAIVSDPQPEPEKAPAQDDVSAMKTKLRLARPPEHR